MKMQKTWLWSFTLVAALLMFAACDTAEEPSTTDTTNTKTGTIPVKTDDGVKKASFFPINNPAVKEVPPTPFQNHWTAASTQNTSKAPLQVFLSRTARRMSFDKLRSIKSKFLPTFCHGLQSAGLHFPP